VLGVGVEPRAEFLESRAPASGVLVRELYALIRMRSTFFCPRLGHIWATNLYDYGVKRAIGSQPRACRINTGYVSDMPVTHEVAGSSSVIPTREFGLYHAQCWLPADRTVTKTSTSKERCSENLCGAYLCPNCTLGPD